MTARFYLCLFLFFTVVRGLPAESLETRSWTVDGVTRKALVYLPVDSDKGGKPVVFAFHGHGGSSEQASRSFPIHQVWPEAIVVYPQGLPTPGALTDPEGKKSGWQPTIGTQDDRDLNFFDAMLSELREKYRVDGQRIYATGHSNGGGFTYLLGVERRKIFAAIAPSSSVLGKNALHFKPLPVLHIAGTEDSLVKFTWQRRNIEFVLKANGAAAFNPDQMGYALHAGKAADVAVYLHSGGHRYPAAATEHIVDFFKAHPQG